MTKDTPLAVRLGVRLDHYDPSSDIAILERIARNEQQFGTDAYKKFRYVDYGWEVVHKSYLLDDFKAARKWAKKTADFAEEYFFGKWREEVPSGNGGNEPPSRQWQDRQRMWVRPLRIALLCCASLERWDLARQFAAFVKDDICRDYDIDAASDMYWHYFCGILTDRRIEEVAPFRESIVKSRLKLDKLLLDFFESAMGTDEGVVQRAAEAYFKQFVRVKARGAVLAEDGSIVLHFARQRGHHLHFDQRVSDRLFVLQ